MMIDQPDDFYQCSDDDDKLIVQQFKQTIFQQFKQIKLSELMHRSDMANEDSDNDEGFIVNTIQINHKQKQSVAHNDKRPNDYQARFILTHNVIRKQLTQLINCYPHFKNIDIVLPEPIKKHNKITSIMHPDQKYINNSNYRLVYQRSHKKFNSYLQIVDSAINLSSIETYSMDNYAIVKNWEDLGENGEDLCFQSRFQSGNLELVYKSLTEHNHYILFIQNDTNTRGYNKWFYFAIKNKRKNINYTFSIVNFRKNFGFFRQGMKPTKFSLKDYERTGNGWSKCGNNISFGKSQLSLNPETEINQYYTLSFQMAFQHENDLSFISLLPPYSYSKLMTFLHQTKQSTKLSHHIKFEITTIAYSLSNTQVPYVTISGPQLSKKNIIIIARQHPGQIWSSYLVESLINQLVRESNLQKDWVLKNYNFRIFPMINVDGVIYGNFRCDLSGMDMNRCWKSPNKLLHPQLVEIKEEIIRLAAQSEVVSFLDFHGHSKDFNIFAYCSQTDLKGRMLPYLISRNNSLFDFSACTYGLSKYKQGTARAVAFDITKATDVITIQSSFFASNNPLKIITPQSFDTLANSIIKAFKYLYSKSPELRQAELALPKAIAAVAQLKLKNSARQQEQNSGSQSEPQLDQITLKQKIGRVIPKCPIIEQCLMQIKEQSEQIQNAEGKKLKKKKKEKKIQIKQVNEGEAQQKQQLLKEQKIPKIAIRGKNVHNKNMILLEKVLNKMSKNGQPQSQSNNKRTMMQSSPSRLPQNSKRYESLELRQGSFHPEQTMREKTTKLQFHYKYQRLDEQFPMLCVLSDRKKQGFLQKLKRIHPTPQPKEKPVVRYEPTLVVNKKLDTMQKLRERQKNSNDLVSSLWKQTIDESCPNTTRSIFYGGL